MEVSKSGFSYLSFLFLLFVFFPYVQLLPIGSYTQPYAYILAVPIFLGFVFYYGRIPGYDSLLIFGLAAVGLALIVGNITEKVSLTEFRYLLAYLVPTFLVPAFFFILQFRKQLFINALRAAIIVWFVIATAQYFFDSSFLMFLVGEWGSHADNIRASGRGVLGLAPEPTHHGFHILIMGAALLVMDRSNLSRFCGLLVILSAVFLASSSSSLLCLIFGCGVLLLIKHPIIASMLLGFGVVFLFVSQGLDLGVASTNSRLLSLVGMFVQDPFGFLALDYSANIRLGGLYAVLTHSFTAGLLPFGIGHNEWMEVRDVILDNNNWLFDLSASGPPSGFGLLLFQGGFLALPFIVGFLFRCIRGLGSGLLADCLVLSVPFIFLSQFYISAPIFSMFYACLIWRSMHQNKYR